MNIGYNSLSVNYHPDIFTARQTQGWDDYMYRLARYEVLDGYYHNMQYHRIRSYSESLKVQEQLYKHVRGVYNPSKRLVDGYVSKVYGGMLDTKRGESGSIPLDTQNDDLRELIASRLWVDSQWGQKKSLYTRFGAKLGDVFINIVDDIDKQQVRLEIVDPMKVKRVERDDDGTIIYIEFEYYVRREGKLVKYHKIITPDTIEVYGTYDEVSTDGVTRFNRLPMHRNGRNEDVEKWDNDYGFVPVQHVMHIDEGLMYGAACTHGLLQKINELNDLSSILNDGQRKQVNLPLVFKGVKATDVDFGSDQSSNSYNTSDNPKKDSMSAVFINKPEGGIEALSPTINIADGLSNIVEILKEIERDSPELSLHRLREGGSLTAPGVRSAYDDAIAKYQEARGNYDTGLVKAQKMAVMIGGMRGYDGYQGFNTMDINDERLEHQIAERPVINDTMSITERQDYTLRGMQSNAPKVFYLKMGWSDSEADEFVSSAQTTRDSFMMASPFETATTTPPVDDPDASPDDAFDSRLNSGLNESDILEADRLLAELA